MRGLLHPSLPSRLVLAQAQEPVVRPQSLRSSPNRPGGHRLCINCAAQEQGEWYEGNISRIHRSSAQKAPPSSRAGQHQSEGSRKSDRSKPTSGSRQRPPSDRAGVMRIGNAYQQAVGPPKVHTPQPEFETAMARLKVLHQEGKPVSKKQWSDLFELIQTREHAQAVMQLLLEDASVREGTDWDWSTAGYGQTVLDFVEVAACAGWVEVTETVLEQATVLHLNTDSKELVPSMMRRLAAANVDMTALRKLFERERYMRGKNTARATHEMSRELRKQGDIQGIQDLLKEAADGHVEIKPALQEDLVTWLSKRGVLV